MTNQEIEQYWRDFNADISVMFAEWREQYDPDHEMNLLELIEAATGPVTFGDIAREAAQ